jgi:hypothetical protein
VQRLGDGAQRLAIVKIQDVDQEEDSQRYHILS